MEEFFHDELNCHLSLKTLNTLVLLSVSNAKLIKLLSLANNSSRLIFNGCILMTIQLRIHRAIVIRKEKINDSCT